MRRDPLPERNLVPAIRAKMAADRRREAEYMRRHQDAMFAQLQKDAEEYRAAKRRRVEERPPIQAPRTNVGDRKFSRSVIQAKANTTAVNTPSKTIASKF